MPELPEVETVCRGLQAQIAGKSIAQVDVFTAKIRTPVPKDLAKTLLKRRILHVTRRAKYILIHLDSGMALVIHLGMSGSIRFVDYAAYTKEKHDHLAIGFDGGDGFVFNDPRRFGMVFHASVAHLDQHAAFSHLGPEPLDRQFTPKVLGSALKSRKTAIKVALMDQEMVVGVGNIYASEALFRSGIDPTRPASSLDTSALTRLCAAIKQVLKEAIASGGSTLRNYRQADGNLGYFQHRFDVYEKAGKPCKGCTCSVAKTGGIQKITQGGRSTYYCPRKQK